MALFGRRRRPSKPKRPLRRRLVDMVLGLPEPLLRSLGGGRLEADGHALDPKVRFLLSRAKRLAAYSQDPVVARTQLRKKVDLVRPEPLLMHRIEDRTIDGPGGDLPLRIYTPPDLMSDPPPAVVFFHGGGWVLGDLESHDALCTLIAQRIPCKVIAVDYRLAPEHPFPAAIDDAVAAFAWAAEHAGDLRIDPLRIAVLGDSAGGNLAAVVALRRRAARRADAEAPEPCAQVLVYPVLDVVRQDGSYEAFAEGLGLDRSTMRWFFQCYVGDENGSTDPDVAPLRAESLDDLPQALVATAGFDVLRDEGVEYAERLEAAGVDTIHLHFPDHVHGFASMTGAVESARAAVDKICSELAYRFHLLDRN